MRSIQPARKLAANKRKKMKENENKIAFICFHKFFRIGTFQGVTADSNKKISLLLTRASGCCQKASKSIFLSFCSTRAVACKNAKVRLRE
jgi:hypothetical protein